MPTDTSCLLTRSLAAQVNREIETVGKSFAGCFSSPYTLAKAIGRKASGAQDTTVTDLYVLKARSFIRWPIPSRLGFLAADLFGIYGPREPRRSARASSTPAR